MGTEKEQKRVLLLMSPATYRAGAFLSAAKKLNLAVVVGIDLPETLSEYWHVPLGLDFADPQASVRTIVDYAREHPIHAVLSVDDSASELAALANAALGLAQNSPRAAEAARDKLLMRTLMSQSGAPCPLFRPFYLRDDPACIAGRVDYPCVLKPTRLSGSRGDFIPGFEVALEGLLTHGQLKVLALFDKPDPLDGPFFEETIYVTPSRLSDETQAAIARCVSIAASSLGLQEGPVHAELRVNERGPWMLEIAGRSIGGLCSTVLEFGSGMCLEELILRHAVGEEITAVERENSAAGVMMIPIPSAGILKAVHGVEEAKQVPLISGIEISAKLNYPLVPLPEGASYLGFIFARGETPAEVEAAIRRAHSLLRFEIRREIPVLRPV